ncbi:hypothetical protein AHAS_Ahas04G0060100 [Arachis hypogaea]
MGTRKRIQYLFNPLVLPSSILVRLVNIYMFRCNNKLLFLTSGFGGWLIGHILFIKWIEFVWIQQNNVIKSNERIRSKKSILSEFRTSMAQLFSVFLFLTSLIFYFSLLVFASFRTLFTHFLLVFVFIFLL